MAKKNTTKKSNVKKKNVKLDNLSSSDGISGGIKVVIVVLVLFVLFYLLTLYILNKKESYSIENNAVIQYTEILAGEVLDQKVDNYFVLFYDKGSDNASSYADIISNYENKTDKRTIFIVDLSEGLNKKFVSADSENRNVTNISDLKVKGPTLLHVVKGKVVDYVTENIEEFLNNN